MRSVRAISRLLLRAPLVRAIAAILLLTVPAASRAIDIDAIVGFGLTTGSRSVFRQDTWTPIAVYLTGQSVSGVGQLQVSVVHGDRSTVYARRVTLREGLLKDPQIE